MRRVEVGPSVGQQRVITTGVTEGDRIVVEGVQKVSDGAVVDPQPDERRRERAAAGARSARTEGR